MTTTPLKLPEISEAEQTPLVQHLLQIIVQQHEEIQALKEEIQRLKGLKGKPKIDPSRLEAETSQEEDSDGETDPRTSQRKKTAQLTIHHEEVVKVAAVPEESVFKGYQKDKISADFDALCAIRTTFATLNQALKRLHRSKAELLLVLNKPWLPLHNNLSERGIREYVKKRKISGSTRSELGRQCRDTFTSLKKTCRKHGISFWEYLKVGVSGVNAILPLPDVIRQAAQTQA